MSKVRCKDCQYFDGASKCHRYEKLSKRNMYDECIEYAHAEYYHKSNYRDSIENVINELTNLVDEEKCFFEPKENYQLEVLARKLVGLVESHGLYSWKYE